MEGGRIGKRKGKKKEILKSRIEFWHEILLSFKIYMGTFLNLLKLSLQKGKGDFFFLMKKFICVCLLAYLCGGQGTTSESQFSLFTA